MKRIAIIAVPLIILMNFSNSFADDSQNIFFLRPLKCQKLSFDYKIDTSSLASYNKEKRQTYSGQPTGDVIFTSISSPHMISISMIPSNFEVKDSRARFSEELRNPYSFSLRKMPSDTNPLSKNKKYYFKTATEITVINATVWAVSKYFIKKSWANISFDSMLWNLKHGFDWDIDTYFTNQFLHPYHGALHYSIAKANGFNYFESVAWAFLGAATAELFFEARGEYNNTPSTNDLIINTLGAMTLGEVLFRTADLVLDESSRGFERFLREFLAFAINPAFGFRIFSRKASKIGYPPEKHYYNLDLPFGFYSSSTHKTCFIVAAHLEYKDFLREDLFKINLYDWFTLDCRLGNGTRNIEFLTTGVLTGKKIKNGLTGLFGVFDYIETQAIERISAVGVGPGLVTTFNSDSDFFFNGSGVLSFIFGGSSPSFDLKNYHFGKKINDPYYLGPGMMGRMKLELGKKGLGSIDTGFSHYWVHSIFTHADEFLGILSLNLKGDLSDKSQLSIGYDYYFRYASFQEERSSRSKNAARVLYILKF